MKSLKIFMACIWVAAVLPASQSSGYSMTSLSIQFKETLRVISLGAPHREILETLGTPDYIKSEGMCLHYEHLGLSIFLNESNRVEQIYLARNFEGFFGAGHAAGGIDLTRIQAEFGHPTSVEKLNYQPSPIVQNKATTETENRTDPSGRPIEDFPLQYPGNRILYIFYNAGNVIKHKYVLDDSGVAFWLDQKGQLYTTVLYMSRGIGLSVDSRIGPDECVQPAAATEKATAGVQKIRLQMIHFDFDKQDIKNIYVPVLDEHVSFLSGNPSWPVTVEGHTDHKGSDAYNQKLSERRAEAVRDYLIRKGIASPRIRVVGYSEDRPIADNRTTGGRAMNRRAELEVTLER